ncbi:NAD(P)H-hydrate epimerase [Branchiostoma belcheri]|nr:NAD(P)H-hydrate epimerase [Branchiostoma belcheri]
MFTCVWMVFSTKERHVHLCVDSVQHQGQACSPVWIVFSTKDRHVHLCVDGVQHQGQACSPVWIVFSTKDRHVHLCVDGVQHQGQTCLPVCGWCSAPRTGIVRFKGVSRLGSAEVGFAYKTRVVGSRFGGWNSVCWECNYPGGPGKGVGPGTYGKRFGDMESWKGKYASGLRFSFRKRYSTEKGGTVDEDCEVISMGHKIGDISYVR